MTAEQIAMVVADLNAGRVGRSPDQGYFDSARKLWAMEPVTIIDASAMYEEITSRTEDIRPYDDYPSLMPPWGSFATCYVNRWGNVHVMHTLALDRRAASDPDEWLEFERWEETAEPVDWDRVRWTLHTHVWMGGVGGGVAVPTHGPRHLWQTAVYEDGTPADHHWVHIVPEYPIEAWEGPWLVMLSTLNFLSCRNVTIVEPTRPRPERRRIARTGVKVHTIHVFPAGKTTRSEKGVPVGGVPLHPVRGHPVHFGDCCPGLHEPRGLAFGRLTGKFWVPQHARGSVDHGENRPDYRLIP